MINIQVPLRFRFNTIKHLSFNCPCWAWPHYFAHFCDNSTQSSFAYKGPATWGINCHLWITSMNIYKFWCTVSNQGSMWFLKSMHSHLKNLTLTISRYIKGLILHFHQTPAQTRLPVRITLITLYKIVIPQHPTILNLYLYVYLLLFFTRLLPHANFMRIYPCCSVLCPHTWRLYLALHIVTN